MEEAEEQPIRGKGHDEEGEVDAVSVQVRNLSLDGKLDGMENGSCVDWGPERSVGGWTLEGIVGDGKEGSAWENHLEAVPRVSEGQQEGDGSYKEDLAGSCPYPQRPGLPDCAHYLRTGRCAYGLNCRFNHPLIGTLTQCLRVLMPFSIHEDVREHQIECKFFSMPGGCRFGNACKFLHSQEKTEMPGIELNFLGLPIRPGQKECPYYMRTGVCKFSSNCRFNHPDPTATNTQDYSPGCQNDHLTPRITSMLFPPNGLNLNPDFRSQIPTSPNYPTESFMQQSLFPAPLSNPIAVHQQVSASFPERPGKAECAYFMKTGDCKFGSTCLYHHPRSRLTMSPSYNVTPGKTPCAYFLKTGDCKFGSACMFYHPSSPTYNVGPHGLPLRPDQPACSFYNRFGICKFGPACKYDHPMGSASSSYGAARPLSDMVRR
ncbi:hypothetical protein ZIOFF_007103 [Zingiber officinale]|uniref:C3H1-type domain-containing protein n=1 Tax=Zingiber officinale TaxID=94328 RepID=A0A8J5HWL4_ZINOF|nr:hypothetical protein ZIOFF_007103 [Zingiber officinale]